MQASPKTLGVYTFSKEATEWKLKFALCKPSGGPKCVISANQRRFTGDPRRIQTQLARAWLFLDTASRENLSGRLGGVPVGHVLYKKNPERCAGDDGALGGVGHTRTLLRLAFQSDTAWALKVGVAWV